ncbi:MAG: hypothetical protein AAGA68_21085 [Pseudomonadota bacterium]
MEGTCDNATIDVAAIAGVRDTSPTIDLLNRLGDTCGEASLP